jgi:hypothetical protein
VALQVLILTRKNQHVLLHLLLLQDLQQFWYIRSVPEIDRLEHALESGVAMIEVQFDKYQGGGKKCPNAVNCD